jgi:hypothetical protein
MKGEGGKAKPTPIDSSRVQVVSDPSAGVGKKVEGGEVSLEVEKELDAFRNTKGGAGQFRLSLTCNNLWLGQEEERRIRKGRKLRKERKPS